jgi:hypothetical protein
MAKSGLFSFNPERILKDTPKPVVTLHVPDIQMVSLDLRLEENLVQTPVIPVTPRTSQGVVSLQRLIKQDAHTLDSTSRWRL